MNYNETYRRLLEIYSEAGLKGDELTAKCTKLADLMFDKDVKRSEQEDQERLKSRKEDLQK